MLLRKDAKIELLRGLPLFADCTKKELQGVAQVAEEIAVEAGSVLIREGDRGHEAFVVVAGRVDVSREGVGTFAVSGPGEVLGEMALFSNRPRNATVTAAVPTRLLRIGDRDFLDLLDRLPHLWLKIAASLADRVPQDERLDVLYRD
jgi:CRP/FNR family transcriptional regulator, cyclic AMP receptor protein